jgi:uncharacterized membrane protein
LSRSRSRFTLRVYEGQGTPNEEMMGLSRKTASGFDENLAGALCYGLGWVTGLIFFATEPENSFVRFHAMQSILVFGTACIALMVCLSIPFLGWILSIFVFYGSAALWLILMFKAYQGERFKLPVAGEIAEQRI